MRGRLSLMMAMVYAVQGAFWPLLAVHLKDLGIGGRERGWIFATMAMGAFAMPLGAGQLVDRLMPAQRLLGLIFAAATGFLVVLAAGALSSPGALFLLFLVFWLTVAPAFALSNTIALRHLERPYEQFAAVRLWGTVGWMAVGWGVSAVMVWTGAAAAGRGAFDAFWVSAALAVLTAAYAFTLPHTPPVVTGPDAGPGTVAGPARLLDGLRLAKEPGMPGFLLTAFGVSLTTPYVFQVMPTYFEAKGMPRAWISSALTLGQWPEIVMLAALPWILRRLGTKGTLTLGIAAWAVRYASLAVDPPLWLAVAGIPLHGVGIACFTIAGQMYVDRRAPQDRRASAQALYMVVTTGLGSLCGSLLAGQVVGRLRGDNAAVFIVPCVIDAALLVYFIAGFRTDAGAGNQAMTPLAARTLRHDAVRGSNPRVGCLVTESADG